VRFYLIMIVFSAVTIFAQIPILEEDFENETFPPEGWILNTTGAGWVEASQHTGGIFNGEKSVSHLDDEGAQDDWIITPLIDIPASGSSVLSFFQASRWTEYLAFHEVAVTSDGGTTWNQIYLDDQPAPNADVTGDLERKVLFLDDFAGHSIQIGWHYTGNYSDQWFIDDISVFSDSEGPVVSSIEGNAVLLPDIGTYLSNDLLIELKLTDASAVQSVLGHYSFDGGTTISDVVFLHSKDIEETWTGTIPAMSTVTSGTINFDLTDNCGNLTSTSDYTIKFVEDLDAPEFIACYGALADVGSPMNPKLKFKDESPIKSCKGYYSKDNYVTVYEFDMNPSKINQYVYSGTIPEENEITKNGEVYFVIEDLPGNTATTQKFSAKWLNGYSSQFDLRTSLGYNCVSPIRQQIGGTCWAYAFSAAMETNLMISGKWAETEASVPDLSEAHLDRWNGFNDFFNAEADPTSGDGLTYNIGGGEILIATAYMSRGEGFVRELDTPDYYDLFERFSEDYHYFYAKDMECFNFDYELNGLDIMKQKVIENGGLVSSFYYGPNFLQENIYYQPRADSSYPNHDVIIVGWDDDLVSQAPEGPGAWLCKNSWGADWGDDGFFWISYYDKWYGHNEFFSASLQNVEPLKYDKIYYHDYHGWRDDYSWGEKNILTNTSEAFNTFISENEEELVAVSFYTVKDNVDYTVIVYDDFNGYELQNDLITATGHIDYKGFHTIDLPTPITIQNSEDFYIYVYLSNGGHAIDQTQEISWYEILTGNSLSYQSTANSGESYYKENEEWLDLYDNTNITSPGTANLCIKALCDDEASGIDHADNAIKGFELYQNYPNPFNPVTTIKFSLPVQSKVNLYVYNVNGQLVSELVNSIKAAGCHTVDFNASALNSGVYYYSLKIDGVNKDTKKMIMIK